MEAGIGRILSLLRWHLSKDLKRMKQSPGCLSGRTHGMKGLGKAQ